MATVARWIASRWVAYAYVDLKQHEAAPLIPEGDATWLLATVMAVDEAVESPDPNRSVKLVQMDIKAADTYSPGAALASTARGPVG